MSIDRMGKGAWRARWRDATGRQRAKTFKTKADAVAFEVQMRARVASGDAVLPSNTNMTVAQLADEWLAASVHIGEGTRTTYELVLRVHVLPAMGAGRIIDLDRSAIQRWIRDELQTVAPATVHKAYRTLHTMLTWAVEVSYLGANPCAGVKPPKVPAPRVAFLTVEQIDALVAEMPARYKALVLVAAWGGLRWGELVGLRRGSVNGARLTITEQLQRRGGVWKREEPKTAAGRRTVLLPASVAAELEAHMATFSEPGADGLVFVNELGNPVGHSFRSNVWLRACLRAGLAVQRRDAKGKLQIYDAPRIHDLRHTAVALGVQAGAHPKAIQQRLGHSSIRVTMDTYGHLFDAVGEEMAADLDALRTKSST